MPTRSLSSVIPDTDTDADNAPQTATTTPATEPSADENAEKPTEKKSGPRKSRKPPPTQPADNADRPPQAVPTGESRTGRARIPKTGPVTRVTVDLAVTEQTQLDKLIGQIGREIGRGHGKNKIYPQHLMRVAIRRLLTDENLRREVTADLAEHRDELKRPQR